MGKCHFRTGALSLSLTFVICSPALAGVSTLVLDLGSRTVPTDQLETLSEELRAELARFDELSVISKRDIVQMLGVEQEKQLLGGCTDDSCMTELAGALGAAKIVSGTIGSAGEQLLVQLQLIDSGSATVERRVSHPAASASALVDAVRAAARKLMAVPGTLHLINQVDGGEVYVADVLVGKMPLRPFPVSESGSVAVRVDHVDYVSYEAEVNMTPGKTTRHILRAHRFTDLEDDAKSRRYWSYGLLGGAVAVYGASVAFFVKGAQAYERYQGRNARQTDQETFDKLEGDIKLFDALSWTSVALGTALAAGGAYLLFHNPHEDMLEEAGAELSFSVLPTSDGAYGMLGGRF